MCVFACGFCAIHRLACIKYTYAYMYMQCVHSWPNIQGVGTFRLSYTFFLAYYAMLHCPIASPIIQETVDIMLHLVHDHEGWV